MNGFEFDFRLLGPLVNRLADELATVHGWWAALAVALCLGLSFAASNAIERRLEARGRGLFAVAWARRVAGPLLALLGMLVARAALQRFVPVSGPRHSGHVPFCRSLRRARRPLTPA